MVDPPKEGRESESTLKLYRSQRDNIMAGLKERASMLEKYFNKMHNVTSCDIEGAMYGFP